MAEKLKFSVKHLLAVVFFIATCQSSLIKFSASPSEIKTNLTRELSMRCSLTNTEINSIGRRSANKRTTSDVTNTTSSDVSDTQRSDVTSNIDSDVHSFKSSDVIDTSSDIYYRSSDVKNTTTDVVRINSFIIRRNDGQEVAFITPFDPPTATVNINNLEVKGSVSGSSSEGYIQLTWRDATGVDLGDYTCEVTALGAGHHNLVFTSSLELTSVEPSVADLVRELNLIVDKQHLREKETSSKISSLEHDNQDLNTTVIKQAQEISDLKQESLSIVQQNVQLSNTVDKLKKCVSERTMFMAVLSHGGQNGISFSNNQRVVFDKVVLNEGGAYNNQTGSFVCKQSGFYEFNVHAVSYGNEDVGLHLNINSEKLTSLYAYDDGHADSASTGAIVHLKAGDIVDVTAADSAAKFYQSHDLWQNNVFTGNLLRSDECVF